MPPLTKVKKADAGLDVIRPASVDEVLKLIQTEVSLERTWIKMLLLADPGVGKTFFAATAEKALLAITEGAVSLGTLAYAQRVLGRKITFAQITSAAEMDGLLGYVEVLVQRDDSPYEVFVVDSITNYCEMVGFELTGGEMISSLDELGEERNRRFWQALLEHMRQFLSRLQQLPMHVICTAHLRRDEKTLYPMVYPEQLRRQIAGKFNLVAYMERSEPLGEDIPVSEDGPPRVLYFDRPGVVTKNAGANKMPVKLFNPTFGEVLRIWRGESQDA